MKQEYIDYFKALFEGRAEVSWNAWFREHENAIASELPRMEFLKLKFDKLDEAERILVREGVPFSKSAAARREKKYSLLHESVLDGKGRPKECFQRKAYDGAIGCFMDGNTEQGVALLKKFVSKLHKRPLMDQVEGLTDLCFVGEMELECGDGSTGRAMLAIVVALPHGNDMLDPIIDRARSVGGFRESI